jgi:recombination protein RecT
MAQSQALTASSANPIVALQSGVLARQGEIAKALPGHITPEKFIRTAQTAIALTRNIEKAGAASLLAACTRAAADGLILDGREAALVVEYNGEVQYRPMMRGLLKLAYNSGQISKVSVQVVCENDAFEYVLGDDERIVHTLNLRAPRGAPYAVYATATLKDGAVIREVMTTAQVNAIRDRSDAYRAFKAGKIKSTPWSTDWEEMARKTVFRRLSKYLPSSSDRDLLASAIERIDDDFTATTEPEPFAPPAPAAKKRGAAAAALKDITPARPQPPAPSAAPAPAPDDEFNQDPGIAPYETSEPTDDDDI